jgi:hypothetical protein
MDLQSFVSLKSSPELDILNQQIINLISQFSGGKKNYKNNIKGNQILKNPKIQLLKDKVENKVNSVLNKLSELNFNNLLLEFIEFLGKLNEKDYIEVQKAFYVKIQSEISFVKIYLEFFKVISNIYKASNNYSSDYFVNIIESKFKYDYLDIEISEEFDFIKSTDDEDKDLSESKRINNLNIINCMIKLNMFNENLEKQLDTYMLEQNNHFSDIYYWFQNKSLSKEIKNIIKNKITNNALSMRSKVLLDNLLEDDIVVNKSVVKASKPVVQEKNIVTDTLEIESENIIEEYIFLGSLEEVKVFIDNRCKDALTKNKFCQYIFNKYFSDSQESSDKLIDLFKVLVKKQILFKSNLSRGLLILYQRWNEIESEYDNSSKKMKELLVCLKNMGITKNLEILLKKYKIEFNDKQDS